jgi:3-hydroxybutyrate dehydrogenase
MSPLFDLDGKRALVTGSSQGIGLALAEGLAAHGASVVINGRDAAKVEKAAQNLSAKGYGAHGLAFDVTLPSVAESIDRIEAEIGAIDILVNNAGILHVAPIDEFPVEKWNAVIAIDLVASFHTIRRVLPPMKERRCGRIINVASAYALISSPSMSAYAAAKHGIAGLTKTVALEVAEHGITVNAVCPGYVLTPLVEKQIPDLAKARGITKEQVVKDVMLAAQPTKQFVTVRQVAAFCAFLAADDAASITGAILPIDGGWTAH